MLDQISRRGGLPVLAALAAAHPKPLNMTVFARETGLASDIARNLRNHYEALGLITTATSHRRGPVLALHIRLTPLGLRIARHALAMQSELEAPR